MHGRTLHGPSFDVHSDPESASGVVSEVQGCPSRRRLLPAKRRPEGTSSGPIQGAQWLRTPHSEDRTTLPARAP